MKGFFFAKPLEYRMETPAEELVQGQSFQGTLQVVNRGGTEEKPLVLEVGLAYGDLKRIKQNEPDAFNLLERHELAEGLTLAPNEEHKAEWEFALASDCPITSSVGCLFLLYGGNLDEPGRWSRIDLRVDLGPELQTFITTLENHFAFEAKSKHYQEGFTEVRFKPPSTYPTLEELSVLMRVRGHDPEIYLHPQGPLPEQGKKADPPQGGSRAHPGKEGVPVAGRPTQPPPFQGAIRRRAERSRANPVAKEMTRASVLGER